jgi:membrane-associated phospholipid phosphatase
MNAPTVESPAEDAEIFAPLIRPLIVAFVLVLAFCAVSYLWIDRPLALWFKANLAGFWSVLFHRLTDLGLGGVWLIPAAVGAVVFRWLQISAKTDRTERNFRIGANGATFLFATVAGSGLLVDLLKGLIGRLRPYELFQHHLYGFAPFSVEWSRNSFPSGHGQTAFAALSTFAVILPRWRIPLYAAALVVAASRVIISVHYLSDVAMGSYLGLVGTILLARLFAARGWELRPD